MLCWWSQGDRVSLTPPWLQLAIPYPRAGSFGQGTL
jgi:hypothetical protein